MLRRLLALLYTIVLCVGCADEHAASATQADEPSEVGIVQMALTIDVMDLALLENGVQSFTVDTELPEGARFSGASIGEGSPVAFTDPEASPWFATLAIDTATVISASASDLVWLDNFGAGRPFPAEPNAGGYPALLQPIGGQMLTLTVQIYPTDPEAGVNTATAGHLDAFVFLAPPVTAAAP